MTEREHTQWLRALRYFSDLIRQRGGCGNGWPVAICGLPAKHDGACPEPRS